MKELKSETLEGIAKRTGVPVAIAQKLLTSLESQGIIFSTKDEVSGKTLWLAFSTMENHDELIH